MVENTNANMVSISIYRTKAYLGGKMGHTVARGVSQGNKNHKFSIGEEYHSDKEIENFIKEMYYSPSKKIATVRQAA